MFWNSHLFVSFPPLAVSIRFVVFAWSLPLESWSIAWSTDWNLILFMREFWSVREKSVTAGRNIEVVLLALADIFHGHTDLVFFILRTCWSASRSNGASRRGLPFAHLFLLNCVTSYLSVISPFRKMTVDMADCMICLFDFHYRFCVWHEERICRTSSAFLPLCGLFISTFNWRDGFVLVSYISVVSCATDQKFCPNEGAISVLSQCVCLQSHAGGRSIATKVCGRSLLCSHSNESFLPAEKFVLVTYFLSSVVLFCVLPLLDHFLLCQSPDRLAFRSRPFSNWWGRVKDVVRRVKLRYGYVKSKEVSLSSTFHQR